MNDRITRATNTIEAAVDQAIKKRDFVQAKKTLVACLRATRRARRRPPSASGSRNSQDEPDYAVRLSGAIKILEWAVGKPARAASTLN